MISCTQLFRLVPDFLEGCLSPGHKQEVEKHLASCPSCRDAVRDFRRIREAAESAESPGIPRERFNQFVPRPVTRPRRAILRPAATSVFAILIIGAGVIISLSRIRPPARGQWPPLVCSVTDNTLPPDEQLRNIIPLMSEEEAAYALTVLLENS